MSCDRRNAHAMPAGPPPTMTTSAGICGRSIPSMDLRKINLPGIEFIMETSVIAVAPSSSNSGSATVAQRIGSGTPSCLQIRIAVKFFTSRCLGTVLVCSVDGL
jgi:hypothetical protein